MSYTPSSLEAARVFLKECSRQETAATFDDVLLEPGYSEIESRQTIDLETWISPLRKIRIPFIAANMDSVCESAMAMAMENLGGLGVIHRYMTYERQIEEVKKTFFIPDGGHMPHVAAAVGVKNGVVEHTKNLVVAGCNFIVIDVAHGYHKLVGDLVKELKALNLVAKDGLPVEYIAGNVAAPDGAEYLCKSGADVIKVGVGPGSLCTTRIVTGHGVPQLTAVAACALVAAAYKKTIIADGGIRTSGDVVKALAGGANTVMCGSLFAGTDQSPGEIFTDAEGKKFKVYRGMASSEAQKEFYGNDPEAPEGTSTTIPYKGSLADVLKQLVAGVRSGLSYSGCMTIKDLQETASWVRITNSGLRESYAHLLQ